jgi:2-polyprenyl-3-methyl-5-hydroxy-6-metoxy-1,4-benzoquinol methylase
MDSSPTCIVCGNRQFKTLFSVDEYSLCKCLQCNLVQTYPLVIQENIDTLYNSSYFEGLMQRRKQELFYQKRILNLIERYKKLGKMLEIGIGVGFFMELAHSRGWDIEGVDPSQAACNYVADTLKLTTHHGTLESLQLPQKHFDVISLRHVFEHIPTPKSFLNELHRIVKDDGIICLAVPNFGGFRSWIEKGKWFHLSIPYHLVHYTPKTLASLLTSCDFEIIKLRTLDLSCSSYLIKLLNLILRLMKRETVNMYVNPQETDPKVDLSHWIISKETIFNGLIARIGFGEEIIVIAKKNLLFSQ